MHLFLNFLSLFLLNYPFLKNFAPPVQNSFRQSCAYKASFSIFDKKSKQILQGPSKVWKSEKKNFPFFKYSNSFNDSKMFILVI